MAEKEPKRRSIIELHHEDDHDHKPWLKVHFVLIPQYVLWCTFSIMGMIGFNPDGSFCDDDINKDSIFTTARGIEKNQCRFWHNSWGGAIFSLLISYIPVIQLDHTDRALVCLVG